MYVDCVRNMNRLVRAINVTFRRELNIEQFSRVRIIVKLVLLVVINYLST